MLHTYLATHLPRLVKTSGVLLVISFAMVLLPRYFTSAGSPPNTSGVGPASHSLGSVPNEVLVKFKQSTTQNDRKSAHDAAHADKVKSIDALNTELVRVRPGTTVGQAIASYKSRGDVVSAEPDARRKVSMTPNDPLYADQWAMPNISAPAAWDITTGSSAVTIGILDTGIDLTHPEFAGRLVPGFNASYNTTDAASLMDDDNHGTGVAGVAAAAGNNGLGVAGVAWNSNIMDVKVCETGYCSIWSEVNGIIWAVDHGAKVLNISIGGSTSGSTFEQDGINYALNHNVVVVAPAGNDGANWVDCPACYPGVIGVAATAADDTKAAFSNYGPAIAIAAPGNGILTTTETYPPGNQQPYCCYYGYPVGYWFMSGTSYASPFVAGAAALIIGQHPTWTPTQVRQQLVQTADPINSPYFTAGRLNVAAALTSAPAPAPNATPVASSSPTPAPAVSSGDTTPPSVVISQPSDGATVTVGKAVLIAATASDNVGVKKVEFWVNGSRKCSVNAAPYRCNWTVPNTAGIAYSLVAKAYDAAGNVASQSVNVVSGHDTTPPIVDITSPAGLAVTLPVNTNVTLAAYASDDVGVAKMEFWVNGSRKCSDNAAPYTCVWKVPSTVGVTYTIVARAYDASGNTASQTVTAVSQ